LIVIIIIGGFMSQTANAWLEIVERILGEFHVVENATPDWLVDSETGRRFKVDRLYPELGLAIRFKGSLGLPGVAALDEIDLMEEAARDEMRAELCRQAGIMPVMINTDSDAPREALDEVLTALSAAARRIAQRRVAQEAKLDLLPRVAAAKTTCQEIMDVVSSPEDLVSFAEAWEDRQFAEESAASLLNLQPGMAVRHSKYGKGLVLRVVPGGEQDEAEIVVQFSNGTMQTFTAEQACRELKICS
jgi:hypothetical protein